MEIYNRATLPQLDLRNLVADEINKMQVSDLEEHNRLVDLRSMAKVSRVRDAAA